MKEGISQVEQDSTVINRCVKYFAAIILWMLLDALKQDKYSICHPVLHFFIYCDRFVVSVAHLQASISTEGDNSSSG